MNAEFPTTRPSDERSEACVLRVGSGPGNTESLGQNLASGTPVHADNGNVINDDDVELDERRLSMDELTTTGTEMDVETNSEFERRLDQLAARERTTAEEIIQIHYDTGRLADDVRTAESNGGTRSIYGRSVMAHIAERLGCTEREVHACLKFACRFTQKEVDELKTRRWPWRGVSALLTTYNAEAMNEFRERYEKEEFENTDELRRKIAERNGEVRKTAKQKPKAGSREVISSIKSLNTALNQYSARLQPDCTRAIKLFLKVGETFPPATAEKIQAAIRDARKHVATLERLLPRLKEELTVALARQVKAEAS